MDFPTPMRVMPQERHTPALRLFEGFGPARSAAVPAAGPVVATGRRGGRLEAMGAVGGRGLLRVMPPLRQYTRAPFVEGVGPADKLNASMGAVRPIGCWAFNE